jgi:hypothetical protein
MLKVDPNADWRLYTNTIPAHAVPLGTVTRDGRETGALVRLASGIHVQINAGVIRSLDQQALGSKRRKSVDGKRIDVYLDAESRLKAAIVGNGNVSAGIRKALGAIDE